MSEDTRPYRIESITRLSQEPLPQREIVTDEIKGCTHCGTSYQFPKGINGWWECPNCGAKNNAGSVVKESSTTDTIPVPRELAVDLVYRLQILSTHHGFNEAFRAATHGELTQLEELLK